MVHSLSPVLWAIFVSVVTAMHSTVLVPEPNVQYCSQCLSTQFLGKGLSAYAETFQPDTCIPHETTSLTASLAATCPAWGSEGKSTVILLNNFDPSNFFDQKIVKHEFCHVVLNANGIAESEQESTCQKLYPAELRLL